MAAKKSFSPPGNIWVNVYPDGDMFGYGSRRRALYARQSQAVTSKYVLAKPRKKVDLGIDIIA